MRQCMYCSETLPPESIATDFCRPECFYAHEAEARQQAMRVWATIGKQTATAIGVEGEVSVTEVSLLPEKP